MNLNPIDCSLEWLNSFSSDKEFNFQPHLRKSSDNEKRGPQVEMFYSFFRQMAETSNTNLVHDHLLASTKEKRDNGEIVWVGLTKQRYDNTKFT